MGVGTVSTRSRAAHLGPELRRPQALDAALAIAAESGVTAVSIGAVADRMGVTRPVVYSCFADRVELMTALLEREERYLLGGVLAALPAHRGNDDPETVFVEGFQALLNTVASRPDSWRLVFQSAPGADLAERFAASRAVVAAQFTRLIRPTLRRWRTRELERKLPVLVEFFMSSSEGAVRSLLSGETAWTPDQLGEFIGRAVYRAFRDA